MLNKNSRSGRHEYVAATSVIPGPQKYSKNGTKPLQIAKKAVVVHTFRVQVGVFCTSGLIKESKALATCLQSPWPGK